MLTWSLSAILSNTMSIVAKAPHLLTPVGHVINNGPRSSPPIDRVLKIRRIFLFIWKISHCIHKIPLKVKDTHYFSKLEYSFSFCWVIWESEVISPFTVVEQREVDGLTGQGKVLRKRNCILIAMFSLNNFLLNRLDLKMWRYHHYALSATFDHQLVDIVCLIKSRHRPEVLHCAFSRPTH